MIKFESGEWVEMDPAALRVSAEDFAGHANAAAAANGFNRVVDVLLGMAEHAAATEIGFDGARLESAVRSARDAVGNDAALAGMTDDQARALAERVF